MARIRRGAPRSSRASTVMPSESGVTSAPGVTAPPAAGGAGAFGAAEPGADGDEQANTASMTTHAKPTSHERTLTMNRRYHARDLDHKHDHLSAQMFFRMRCTSVRIA